MIPSDWVEQATRRINGLIQRTPLTYDPDIDLYLKWENRQKTGSFKIRGALNKIMALEPWEQQRGLVTASAGNHGQGVAIAGKQVSAPVTVFASEHAVLAKLEAMRALGAEVRLVPGGYDAAERAGLRHAAETGATWVSPYNDGQVIAGQATLGVEILEQMAGDPPAVILAPVGGGGLAAGIAAAIEWAGAKTRLVGVQSEASPFFYEIYRRGSQEGVTELESLADGLAGAVEEGSITIPVVRRCMDDFLLVSEEQIARAIAYAWFRHGEKIEGSAAAALAAALASARERKLQAGGALSEKPVVAVISGGNIQPEIHAEICNRWKDHWKVSSSG